MKTDRIWTFAALVTSFREDESVNYEMIRLEALRQVKAGNSLFVCGTNGDFSSLTFQEKVEIVKTCVEAGEGKTRIIANAGCPSTHETLLLAREFSAMGVDGIAVITPYFIACTQEGLAAHYTRIADALTLPVYIYEIPARTGNSVAVETVARLAEHPNIAGIKDSSGKAERLSGLAEIVRTRPGFELYSGTDSLILPGLKLGASGCVSGLANLVPEWIREVAVAFGKGDLAAAEAAQDKINRFREAVYAPGYPPAMVKRAMVLMEPLLGNNRLPSLVPDEAVDRALREVIGNFGLTHAF